MNDPQNMIISIVIPTINEAQRIGALLQYLKSNCDPSICEIIVADGGSSDQTVPLAIESGAKVLKTNRGRACQLNAGAKEAKGEILYFLHADTLPPKHFVVLIREAILAGKMAGCFRSHFDSSRKALKLNTWFTRFDGFYSGGGDQSLFIHRKVFDSHGGYDEKCIIMEDFDLTRKLKRAGSFCILQEEILVSARKYENNSYFRVSAANSIIFTLYRLGLPLKRLHQLYSVLIKSHPGSIGETKQTLE
jgi:rSAM/selenodomain-associated transferase 2